MEVKETKVYMTEIKFWNEITDAEDQFNCIVCAKTISEVDEKILKEVGESLISIISINELTDYGFIK